MVTAPIDALSGGEEVMSLTDLCVTVPAETPIQGREALPSVSSECVCVS